MNKKISSRIAIIAIIVLPVVLYYVMRQATIVVNYVPILGEREYDSLKKTPFITQSPHSNLPIS